VSTEPTALAGIACMQRLPEAVNSSNWVHLKLESPYVASRLRSVPHSPSNGTLFCVQNLIFRFLQSRQKVQIWLYEQADLRIEGRIIVSSQSTI